MSEEQLKVFLEAVKADPALQQKLKGATDAEAVVEIARQAGFVISVEEADYDNLTDEELEGLHLNACTSTASCYMPISCPSTWGC